MSDVAPVGHFTHICLQAASLLAQGYNAEQVANHLTIPRSLIEVWMGSKVFRAQVEAYFKEIEKAIIQYTPQKMTRLQVIAVDELEHLLSAESEAVRLATVKEVLDRGHLRVQKGVDVSTLPRGTVILQERMMLAIQKESAMTGDTEMQEALQAVIDVTSPPPSPSPVTSTENEQAQNGHVSEGGGHT
mgnify:CR=1 FL=1